MWILTLILTVVDATLVMAPASPHDRVKPSHKDQAAESAKRVKELQRERLAILREMASVINYQYKNGVRSPVDVYEARLRILKAELDAAEKESERITFYRSIVDVMKEYEKWADTRREAAPGTAATALEVKARRLEAEIGLERAKLKEANEAK